MRACHDHDLTSGRASNELLWSRRRLFSLYRHFLHLAFALRVDIFVEIGVWSSSKLVFSNTGFEMPASCRECRKFVGRSTEGTIAHSSCLAWEGFDPDLFQILSY